MIYLAAQLDERIVQKPSGEEENSSPNSVVSGEHVRVIVNAGKHRWVFGIDPQQRRYCTCDGIADTRAGWEGKAFLKQTGWFAKIGLPRSLFTDPSDLRVDVIYRRGSRQSAADFELCPTYRLGTHPDMIPDWKPALGESMARLQIE
jgi:hypothetical protein